MQIDFALVSPPIKTVLKHYLRTARLILAIVVVTTLIGALANIAAPYLFSRLIDRLDLQSVTAGLVWAFMGYAVLMGAGFALQRVSSFLTFLTSESLNFVTSTAFFERLVDKTSAFFLDHNPAEIKNAQVKGSSALNIVVQFALAAVLPSAAQLTLSLALLWTVLDVEIALIVLVYGVIYVALVARAAHTTRPHLDEAIAQRQASSRFV